MTHGPVQKSMSPFLKKLSYIFVGCLPVTKLHVKSVQFACLCNTVRKSCCNGIIICKSELTF